MNKEGITYSSYLQYVEENLPLSWRKVSQKYNVEKQGATSVTVLKEDSRRLNDYFSFDKILLDAPCSGSGTENVFSEKFTEELINRSIKTQEELLVKALSILKSGGEMVYSTCSILKDENMKKKLILFN